MANEEHLHFLKCGTSDIGIWEEWRKAHPYIQADLSGAQLKNTKLRGINLIFACLENADLSGADLAEANLGKADLVGALLEGANLSKAWLESADLDEAKLSGANLSDAHLKFSVCRGTVFSQANLTNANMKHAFLVDSNFERADLTRAQLYRTTFTSSNLREVAMNQAILGGTVFVNSNLSKVKGLDTCEHIGPSFIDHRTLQQSGMLPLPFLRGCGLPDGLIDYLPSIVNQPFQFYSCFISYSSKDQECAERLHADLQGKGVRCWFAPEDMKTGDKILDRIDQEIRIFDKLLIIFSEHSIGSDWVETEVQAALEKERQAKHTVLFPIRLDDAVMDTGKAWAAKVRRERHITDFRGWKNHDIYQKQFARLLRDLQAVDAQEAIAVEPAPPPKPKPKPTETYRVFLRQNLVASFNDSELRDLCFDMNVDYQSLSGENKADKARELIAFCERRQIVPGLVAKCKELRPKVEWEGEYE